MIDKLKNLIYGTKGRDQKVATQRPERADAS